MEHTKNKLPKLKSYYDGMTRGHSVRKKTGDFPFTSAEAAEIANRCNSHDALLAVLKRIADECFEAMEGAGLPEFENYGCWMNIAKQAIAKAENQ